MSCQKARHLAKQDVMPRHGGAHFNAADVLAQKSAATWSPLGIPKTFKPLQWPDVFGGKLRFAIEEPDVFCLAFLKGVFKIFKGSVFVVCI